MSSERSKIKSFYKRSPIVTVLGHIDSGKTSLLDKMRGTAVQKREAGGITQHIGASFFPIETIKSICGDLINKLKIELKIPGLLVIDTPGHEVFWNLRRRGGSVSDIAILVVDILKGFQAQTYECINILKDRKTPFIVAANKIDRIPGWVPFEDKSFLYSFRRQREDVRERLNQYVYSIIGELSREGFKSERYDKVKDFTREVTIVPTSALTGEGIQDLLLVLAGLTQQYMSSRLMASAGPGKGVVLEVKDEIGLGRVIDVILYDGIIRKNDTIVIGGMEGPIVTHIRSLLLPKPLDEIRDPRDRFNSVDEVHAAAGVRIAAPNLEDVVSGSPISVVWDEEKIEKVASDIMKDLERIRIKTDSIGVVIKADTLGSLEAITDYFKRFGIPIRMADVGDVSKRDVVEASAVKDEDVVYGVILAFNVKVLPDALEKAKEFGVKIFSDNIIYRIFESYERWVSEMRELEKRKKLEAIVRPGKIKVLPNYIFRMSKPAIVGVEVLSGTIKPNYELMREDGKKVGRILQIQDRGKNLQIARKGSAVAISIKGGVVGRNIKPGDILYVDIPISHVKKMIREMRDLLSEEELMLLEEVRKIKTELA
ncbi:MAG: translation initiation factor IF-2 [Candidatus Asgardarchaeia archaeon]